MKKYKFGKGSGSGKTRKAPPKAKATPPKRVTPKRKSTPKPKRKPRKGDGFFPMNKEKCSKYGSELQEARSSGGTGLNFCRWWQEGKYS